MYNTGWAKSRRALDCFFREGRCYDRGNFSRTRLSGSRLSWPKLAKARFGLVRTFHRLEEKPAVSFGSHSNPRLLYVAQEFRSAKKLFEVKILVPFWNMVQTGIRINVLTRILCNVNALQNHSRQVYKSKCSQWEQPHVSKIVFACDNLKSNFHAAYITIVEFCKGFCHIHHILAFLLTQDDVTQVSCWYFFHLGLKIDTVDVSSNSTAADLVNSNRSYFRLHSAVACSLV